MDKKEIQSVWAAYLEVQEAKKKKMDAVGKEDGDIDNDGDKDSSDEYLANRRKAISKDMKKDDVKEGEESPYPSLDKKKREKKGSNLEPANTPSDKLKGESVEEASCDSKTRKEEDEVECPKCKGKGCDHCDGTGKHKVQKEYGMVKAGKKMKESALFSEEELAAIEERVGTKGPANAPAEPFMSTNSASEKKTFADHEAGSDKKLEDYEEMGEMDAAKAGKGGPSQSSARRGDNLKVGDNSMPTPKKAKGQ
jgi:hypothetical protein